jgi:hypothetical protein
VAIGIDITLAAVQLGVLLGVAQRGARDEAVAESVIEPGRQAIDVEIVGRRAPTDFRLAVADRAGDEVAPAVETRTRFRGLVRIEGLADEARDRDRAGRRGQRQSAEGAALRARPKGGDARLEVVELRLSGLQGDVHHGQRGVGKQLVEGVGDLAGIRTGEALAAGEQVGLLRSALCGGKACDGRAGVLDHTAEFAFRAR